MKDSSYMVTKLHGEKEIMNNTFFYSQCKLKCFNHIKPDRICVWVFMIYYVKVVVKKKVYFISERCVRASLRDFLKSHRVSEERKKKKKKKIRLHFRFKVCS